MSPRMQARPHSQQRVLEVTGAEAQAMFEAMFDHKPHTDTRTPSDVAGMRHLWRGE